ncbi:MAG: hypothetical protein JWM52_260 [Candidatus Saccharibacteria bacterium]|nr:hypothetical protein [Candidatus Saccharibacteria bacterium]
MPGGGEQTVAGLFVGAADGSADGTGCGSEEGTGAGAGGVGSTRGVFVVGCSTVTSPGPEVAGGPPPVPPAPFSYGELPWSSLQSG